MQYDKEIIRILLEAGEDGLSVQKISRHVFNACNSLFSPIEQKDVHAYVQQYLIRVTKNKNSIIEKTQKGIYRLNLDNQETQQLCLQFTDEKEADNVQEKEVDNSLSLFDF
ncbi:hypothetical protein [Prevotella sp. HUN102]|uniref:hypothetical protein n=1 Tax=Prevotella sp. HUN102 TaxID=1392486 RepID=UPI00048F5B70|nr:hypothetical protein [Prevotella sp. HUN102]